MKINLKDNNYQIFDDAISEEKQNAILDLLLSSEFPWYHNSSTILNQTEKKSNKDWLDDFQFTHNFIREGQVHSNDFHVIFENLLKQIPPTEEGIERIKANLQINNGFKIQDGIPHTDTDSIHYVALYYVNDSDGDTILYNEDKTEMVRISPKKGRLIFFRGNITHTSSVPKKYRMRMVININILSNRDDLGMS